MADVEGRITLITTGGDAAAAEINKATDAIQRTTTSSSQMQSQFQQGTEEGTMPVISYERGSQIEGGHCIVAVGYDANGAGMQWSWRAR